MESISLNQLRIVEDQLHQIQEAIQNLKECVTILLMGIST